MDYDFLENPEIIVKSYPGKLYGDYIEVKY
jgi:hypothetical protein